MAMVIRTRTAYALVLLNPCRCIHLALIHICHHRTLSGAACKLANLHHSLTPCGIVTPHCPSKRSTRKVLPLSVNALGRPWEPPSPTTRRLSTWAWVQHTN